MDHPTDPEPTAPTSELEGMLRLSHAQADECVAVAGPHSLDNVLDLCRRGFAHVICACGERQRYVAERNDLLIVGGPLQDAQLSAVIGNVAGLLESEGALVVHLTDVNQDRILAESLERAGLNVQSSVFDVSDTVLVTHRVSRHQLGKAA